MKKGGEDNDVTAKGNSENAIGIAAGYLGNAQPSQNKNQRGKCTWALMLHSLSRKPLNAGSVKGEKRTINILYQIPSIPKVKTSIIRLACNRNQGKIKERMRKTFVIDLTWVCFFNELCWKGRKI